MNPPNRFLYYVLSLPTKNCKRLFAPVPGVIAIHPGFFILET